ncbi:TIGR04283 family arsenosugar biosynthesis glycosyltransferase [Gilvimarinus sp. F26214L]|uniref:TIGR04283 family arsenosugar biosynthesis glycosyltransferase n=1 Tax=Gilvimarinus sp. DZF01 TaxID=3461371 RepID=UPI004046598C
MPGPERQHYLSILIPALNEVQTLPLLIGQLRDQQGVTLDIVVADGGSTDGTRGWLEQQADVRVVNTPPGRARQLNAAARAARYSQLLFLHADSGLSNPHLLRNALDHWRKYKAAAAHPCAGHFPLRFTPSDERHRFAFAYLEAKSACNRRHTVNGDQGMLLDATFFEQLGGFDESLPFMEDQAIGDRIFANGQWMVLPGTLTTSARRFETEGFHGRYWLMGLMMACYWTGARGFFARARQVYPAQGQTRRLYLWPYMKVFWMFLWGAGPKQTLVYCYRLGRYASENSWQASFFLDVGLEHLSGKSSRAVSRFHDRLVAPLLRNPLAHGVLAVLVIMVLGLVSAGAWLSHIAGNHTAGRQDQSIKRSR